MSYIIIHYRGGILLFFTTWEVPTPVMSTARVPAKPSDRASTLRLSLANSTHGRTSRRVNKEPWMWALHGMTGASRVGYDEALPTHLLTQKAPCRSVTIGRVAVQADLAVTRDTLLLMLCKVGRTGGSSGLSTETSAGVAPCLACVDGRVVVPPRRRIRLHAWQQQFNSGACDSISAHVARQRLLDGESGSRKPRPGATTACSGWASLLP